MASKHDDIFPYQTPHLPPELWSEVIDFLSRADLYNFSMVNSTFFDIAALLLFKKIRFRSTRVFNQSLPFWIRTGTSTSNLCDVSHPVVSRLPQSTGIASVVKSITFGSDTITSSFQGDELNFDIPRLLELLPSLSNVMVLKITSCYFSLHDLLHSISLLPSLEEVVVFDVRCSSADQRRRLINEGFPFLEIQRDFSPPQSPSPTANPLDDNNSQSLPSVKMDDGDAYPANLKSLSITEVNHESLRRDEETHIIRSLLKSTRLERLVLDWGIARRVLSPRPMSRGDWQGQLVTDKLLEFVLVGTQDMDALDSWGDEDPDTETVSIGWEYGITKLLTSTRANITTLNLCDGRSNHFGPVRHDLTFPNLNTFQGCIPFLLSLARQSEVHHLHKLRTHLCQSDLEIRLDGLFHVAHHTPNVRVLELDITIAGYLRPVG